MLYKTLQIIDIREYSGLADCLANRKLNDPANYTKTFFFQNFCV